MSTNIDLNNDVPVYHYLSSDRFGQLIQNGGLFVRAAFNFEDKDDCLIPFCRKYLPLHGKIPPQCSVCGLKKSLGNECISSHTILQRLSECRSIREVVGLLIFYINARLSLATLKREDTIFTDELVCSLAEIFFSELKGYSPDSKIESECLIKAYCCLQTEIHRELARASLISCWTMVAPDSPENTMWHAHAGGGGFCLSSTVGKLKKLFEEKCCSFEKFEVFADKVTYLSASQYANLQKEGEKKDSECNSGEEFVKSWVFNKKEEWSFEKEVRFYLRLKQPFAFWGRAKGNTWNHRLFNLVGAVNAVYSNLTEEMIPPRFKDFCEKDLGVQLHSCAPSPVSNPPRWGDRAEPF